MTQDSMTISNCAIDRIHVAAKVNELDSIKDSIQLLTNSNSWEEIEPSGRYANAIQESGTGIAIKWNDFVEGSKNPQNGKLLCTVVGDWLRSQDLNKQLIIPIFLKEYYSVSRLDLKFQLNNPVVPIAAIQEIAYQTRLNKRYKIDYQGFDGFVNHDSGWKTDEHRSRSVEFRHKSHDKELLSIYDPFVKHGIVNAQHWELRLRGHYVEPVIRKLEPKRKDTKLSSKLIVESILNSIDFTLDNRTWSWYNKIKNAPLVM